jgi:hypothetical protein
MKITDMRRLVVEADAKQKTGADSDQKAHNEYFIFLQKKANLGRPLTKSEQEFIKTFKLKQLTKGKFEDQVSEDQLDEVKMSPAVFAKWAASSEAEGIRAGFEAEMIFRNTQGNDNDSDELEPDYDSDERSRSIEDIIDFFSNDDWGYGISGRGATRLREELGEEFAEWRMEKISERWDNEAEDQIRDYMETNIWGDDDERESRIRDRVEEMFGDEEADAIMNAGEEAPRFTKSSDQDEYAKNNELYQKFKQASDAAYEEFEAEVEDASGDSSSKYYQDAYEYYQEMVLDDSDFDESDWLEDIGYRYMSDVANDRSLDWPVMMGRPSQGEREWSDIASELRGALSGNYEVKSSSGYHSVTRKENRWIVEPDGSLEPDDNDDMGLEIISPPLPLNVALEELENVINWGNDSADAYTNSSTGLHMGISLPFKGGDVDYVKLALFMGDQYVLEKFERTGNTYCASALEKLKQTQLARKQGSRNPEKTADALELIKKNLIELAQRYVQDGVGNSKYTSAHIKDGYIEFRSPGGDYLAMANRNELDDIKNTMLRFAYSMYLAGRPDLEREEYAKKLYKLLSISSGGDDALKLFADYASGTISGDDLKVQWAKQVLTKEVPDINLKTYEVFNTQTNQVLDIIRAPEYSDAFDKFREKYRDNSDWSELDLRDYRGDPEELLPKDKLTRRGEVAKRITAQPKMYRVSIGDKSIDVIAKDENDAKVRAGQQDEYFNRSRSYLSVKLLTTRLQARDNERDATAIKAKLGEPQPAGSVRDTGYYRVTWDERRNGEVQSDALNIDSASAETAREHVLNALQSQGRDVIQISAHPQQPPAWRRDREPVPGSTLDIQRQRARGEFTGQWKVMVDGEEVYRFGGVGNNQGDANRVGRRWVQQQIQQGALDIANDADVEVVPITESSMIAEEEHILYVNDKPAAKYRNEFDAHHDLAMLARKFPGKKFAVKKEVCTLKTIRQIGEGGSYLDNPAPTPAEIISKHGMTEQELIHQLKLGIKAELEHTNDTRAAMGIALNNINKIPNYYDKL